MIYIVVTINNFDSLIPFAFKNRDAALHFFNQEVDQLADTLKSVVLFETNGTITNKLHQKYSSK